jgi:Arc/MetJ-type ribon-helix-helix transcriptional regulator
VEPPGFAYWLLAIGSSNGGHETHPAAVDGQSYRGYDRLMSVAKVAISIDPRLLRRLDSLVEREVFRSRSEAIQKAVAEKLERLDRSRLARECAKLSPREEQGTADEGLSEDFAEWPEY